MIKCIPTVLKDRQRQMEKRLKDGFGLQGSSNDDEKMMIRFKSNFKDRRKKMERLLNASYDFE